MGDRNYHEFTENINDASMCVCGVPDLGHDQVYPRPQIWSPEDHCFREDGCGWHGSAPADGSCCCCGQPADAHTGCDCE